MSNTLFITVEDLPTTLLSFDQIQVHRAPTVTGVFTEITTVGTRIILNDQDDLYKFIDAPGVDTDFYKTVFFNSITTVSGVFSDPVLALPLEQLKENMQVTIQIDDSVSNTSGVSLTEDLELYFTTTYNPLYCAVKRVRLDIGAFLGEVPEDTINLAIFEASREADLLTFVTDPTLLANGFYKHVRRQYSCCKASEILLGNLIGGSGGSVRSKRLGDFAVEYDTLGVENMLNKLRACIERWEPQLNSGGRATQKPTMVIKGDLDPDRPEFGRGWDNTAPFHRIPIGNAKVKFRNRRRTKTSGRLPRFKIWWETD